MAGIQSVKVCVLSNVLMGADIRPWDVDRTGIRAITTEKIKEAQQVAIASGGLICSVNVGRRNGQSEGRAGRSARG